MSLEHQEEVAELKGQILDLQQANSDLKEQITRLYQEIKEKGEEIEGLEREKDDLECKLDLAKDKEEDVLVLYRERLKLAGEIIEEADLARTWNTPGHKLYDLLTDWIRGEIPE